MDADRPTPTIAAPSPSPVEVPPTHRFLPQMPELERFGCGCCWRWTWRPLRRLLILVKWDMGPYS